MLPFRGEGTPIGVYLIGCIFLASAVGCSTLFFSQTNQARWFGAIAAPICLFLSVGVFLRINAVRVMLVQLLSFSLLLHAILVGVSMLGMLPERLPVIPTVLQILIVSWILAYLLRLDVRLAFSNDSNRTEPASEPEPGGDTGGRQQTGDGNSEFKPT